MRIPKPFIVLCVVAVLWAGALVVFGPTEPPAANARGVVSPAPKEPATAPRIAAQPPPPRPRPQLPSLATPGAAVEPPTERVKSVEAERATTLVASLRSAVSRVEMFPIYRDSAEAAANQAHGYLTGFIDTVTTIAPDLADEVADEIEQVFCASKASDGQILLLLRLAGDQPAFATEEGLSCVLSKRLGPEPREDIVLWTALDAWRSAKLPETPDMARLGQRTQDERTQRALALLRGDVSDRRELR